MSEEDVREHLQRAVDLVAAGHVDPEDAEELFAEYESRIDFIRAARGEA